MRDPEVGTEGSYKTPTDPQVGTEKTPRDPEVGTEGTAKTLRIFFLYNSASDGHVYGYNVICNFPLLNP